MPRSAEFEAIARTLAARLGIECAPAPERSVGGGSINDCYRWRCADGAMFVKIAPRSQAPAFEVEAAGLQELAAARAVRVPEVLAAGVAGERAFLALEWIETGSATPAAEAKLGERLAALHRVRATQFGWHRDNTIGRTPQVNGRLSDWTAFFRERRLRFQLDLAVRNGFARELEERGGRLLECVADLLAGHRPEPSLLHGDLWGGNWIVDSRGEPVLVDPAVYYGDREADLAMTHLFGGFGRRFYAAYETSWPLPPGHEVRRELYNLYHVLNHANLFGHGYVRQAAAMIDALLAEAGR